MTMASGPPTVCKGAIGGRELASGFGSVVIEPEGPEIVPKGTAGPIPTGMPAGANRPEVATTVVDEAWPLEAWEPAEVCPGREAAPLAARDSPDASRVPGWLSGTASAKAPPAPITSATTTARIFGSLTRLLSTFPDEG
jgi:hypothetical protein